MPRIVISAAHRSSGKTTVAIGLCAAFAGLGRNVQAFKKGPDYIDPMWLSAASGRSCRNLDHYLMGEENLLSVFSRGAEGADLSLIEGNAGLFDSIDVDGKGSTATLARFLDAPVVLVVDCHGMNRGIAPLLMGYRQFDPGLPIAGVILNRVGGPRHEAKLRAALKKYTDVEVLGAIPSVPQVIIPERHLGLLPAKEESGASSIIAAIAEVVSKHVDLDRVFAIAGSSPPLSSSCCPPDRSSASPGRPSSSKVRIGIASDQAFTFYYPENLEALQNAGAELVPFSPIADPHLPSVSGLFIGGGFPEVFMDRLEANHSLRVEIRAAIEAGLPVYAECGGLMYLAREIRWEGTVRQMVGAIPCDIRMTARPQGHGYMLIEETGRSPWLLGGAVSKGRIKAHEFHHSEVVNLSGAEFAYKVVRGHGVDGRHDGIVYRNVLASYAHIHGVGTPMWAERFVEFVRQSQSQGVVPVRGTGGKNE